MIKKWADYSRHHFVRWLNIDVESDYKDGIIIARAGDNDFETSQAAAARGRQALCDGQKARRRETVCEEAYTGEDTQTKTPAKGKGSEAQAG